jgi:pyruvate dehydrogenase E2 component (dihydrolipoyllysine-residue acetyltransferase)
MPRLSDSMEEGTILKWLKADGDPVSRGEELVEIETDKATMVYEADEEGVLAIVAAEGATVAVGAPIASIGAPAADGDASVAAVAAEGAPDGEARPEAGDGDRVTAGDGAADGLGEASKEPGADTPLSEEPSPVPEPAATATAVPAAAEGNGSVRVKASPVARRMARERGIELGQVRGTGPGGRIVKSDVEAAAPGAAAPATQAPPAPAPAPPPAPVAAPAPAQPPAPQPVAAAGDPGTGRGVTTTQDLTRLQQTVARRMAESKATAPEFVISAEVDMTAAVAFRAQLKALVTDGPAPSFNDLVIKASALALRDFPRANGAYRDGRFELYGRVNVGVAVAGQDALVVPTVFDADTKGLGAIAAEARRLAERVREGTITPPELSAGTFTVSNLGMYGIRRFTAVINPPQAAILAVGELAERPVVRDGALAIAPTMELTLSCDHRILYGADAAQFLARIRAYLEEPLRLAL